MQPCDFLRGPRARSRPGGGGDIGDLAVVDIAERELDPGAPAGGELL